MKVSEVRREVVERMGTDVALDPGDALLPCRYCGEPTRRKTLSYLGARCEPCFVQFQRLGYSGEQPPRQAKQAAWVKAAAARIKARRAGRGEPNAFAALPPQLHERQAERGAPKGLSDDEANALLAEVRQ